MLEERELIQNPACWEEGGDNKNRYMGEREVIQTAAWGREGDNKIRCVGEKRELTQTAACWERES